jgi:lysophospholipase L1-like esterase
MVFKKALRGTFVVLAAFALLAACAGTPKAANQPNGGADAPRILIYGDSITWGFVPLENPSPPQRFPFSVRWPGVIQNELGADFTVIEEGLNSRTAGVDDYSKALDPSIRDDFNLNGRPTLLPILRSHEPLALVLIMLGTNDTRLYQNQTLEDIEASITHLIKIVKLGATRGYEPKILLVAPPPGQSGVSPGLNSLFEGSYDQAKQLGKIYEKIAQDEEVYFFNAETIIPIADGIDGIHLSPEGNSKLGKALAAQIGNILK